MRPFPTAFLSSWSIRKALYALVLCALCPALLVIVSYGVGDYRRAKADTRTQSQNVARALASQQRVVTESSRILLNTLARLPEVKAADIAAMNGLFKELRAVHSNYANISFVDMNGFLVSSSNPFTPPIIAYDRKYFKDAVRTGKFSVGEYIIGRVVTEPIIHFSTPVFNTAGDMVGVLVATLKLDLYDTLFSDIALSHTWRFALLDHRGVRLHRYPVGNLAPAGEPVFASTRKALEESAADEGTYTAVGPDGLTVEYAFEKLRLASQDAPYMVIVVGLPVNAFAQVFVAKVFPSFTLLLVILGLALLIARFLGTMTIGSGLDRLASATRRLAGGDLSVRVGALSSCKEIGALGRDFDHLAGALARESTERLQAEGELLKARSYITNILDSMPSVVVGVDPHCVVTHWNKAAEHIVGIPARSARGSRLEAVFPRMGVHLDAVQTALHERQPQRIEREAFELDGETQYQDVMIYPLISNGIEGAVVRVDDVTRRVHIEEMMVQSEKMTSIGGLAAGMAHEINNPLSGILQSAQVLSLRFSSDLAANVQAAQDSGCTMENISAYVKNRNVLYFLEGIRESGQRAANIVSNMLEFSRKSQSQHSATDINLLLDKAVNLAKSDYDLKKKYDFKHVAIAREYSSNLPEVLCTRTEIEQVVLNLLKNATQAMALQKDRTIGPVITLRTDLDGDYIRLEVEDNGPGMSEAVRKRIFEPFFTTKTVGEGTGLGLSVSYFIVVTNHSGKFDVQSVPGKGTRFIVRLPLP